MELALVPPRLDAPRSGHVAAVSAVNEDVFELELEFEPPGDQWDEAALEQLVGCHVLVRRADMPYAACEADVSFLTGMRVVDATYGELGSVVRLESYPAQEMLVVQRAERVDGVSGTTEMTSATDAADRQGSELLIPNVEPLVVRIDAECRVIFVDLPAGFLGLSRT